MNKTLIERQFGKAVQTYDEHAVVQRRISLKMIDLLKKHTSCAFGRIYEFGCGTGAYSRLLKQEFHPQNLFLNDLCSEMQQACEDLLDNGVLFCEGDAEKMCLPNEIDLLTSCSTLQWFNAPIDFLLNSKPFIRENGILAFSTFGENNLKEVAQLTGTGLKYTGKTAFEQALGKAYDIVYSEEETFTLTFRHPLDVLYHLKKTGVNGIAAYRFTQSKLRRFADEYACFMNDDGFYPLSYHPIYMILKNKTIPA